MPKRDEYFDVETDNLNETEIEPEEAIIPEASNPVVDQPYTLGSWNGLPQYQCNYCPWDTVESEAAILEHIQQCHTEPKPVLKNLIQAYDRFDNPIEIKEE